MVCTTLKFYVHVQNLENYNTTWHLNLRILIVFIGVCYTQQSIHLNDGKTSPKSLSSHQYDVKFSRK